MQKRNVWWSGCNARERFLKFSSRLGRLNDGKNKLLRVSTHQIKILSSFHSFKSIINTKNCEKVFRFNFPRRRFCSLPRETFVCYHFACLLFNMISAKIMSSLKELLTGIATETRLYVDAKRDKAKNEK